MSRRKITCDILEVQNHQGAILHAETTARMIESGQRRAPCTHERVWKRRMHIFSYFPNKRTVLNFEVYLTYELTHPVGLGLVQFL